MSENPIVKKIEELKKEKNAIIMAHYYTTAEVQQVADLLGDSLALSQQAASTKADIILFAGVHFMAETAKVLCPDRKVLIPVPEAGCLLAESCPADSFARFREKYPDHTVVSYVNTSVEVKALSDICCTSSNALDIVRSIPSDKPVIFGPDKNLGAYVQKMTGRRNMVLWDGACHVHEKFSREGIRRMRAKYPDAEVVAHPECRAEVVEEADFTGSTAAILSYCGRSAKKSFIVATEVGILYEMKRRYPEKEFIPAEVDGGGCGECEYMKMITLENIYTTLRDEKPEIVLDEQVRRKAERSIRNMIER